jgi:hypothetical protein
MNRILLFCLLAFLSLASNLQAQPNDTFILNMGGPDQTFYLDTIEFHDSICAGLGFVNNTGRTVIVTAIEIYPLSGESFTITDPATVKQWFTCGPGGGFQGPTFCWKPSDSANETATLSIGVTYHNASPDSTYGAAGCIVTATEFNPVKSSTSGKTCLGKTSDPSLSYPTIIGGSTPSDLYVVNKNAKWPSIIGGMRITGPDSSAFKNSGFGFPQTIPESGTADITIQFNANGPETQTHYSATAIVDGVNDSCGPVTFNLEANASGSTSTDSLFGIWNLGGSNIYFVTHSSAPVTRYFTLVNHTKNSYSISNATVGYGDFFVPNFSTPRTFNPGDTLGFPITYSPPYPNDENPGEIIFSGAAFVINLTGIWLPESDVTNLRQSQEYFLINPNPASSIVTFSSNEVKDATFEIYDLLGNKIDGIQASGSTTSWQRPTGTQDDDTYFVRMTGHDLNSNQPVVETKRLLLR